MFEKIKIGKVVVFTMLLLVLGAGIVYAATFQQGYDVGCGIGSAETYVGENQTLYLNTVAMANLAGEIDYRDGVEAGYPACKYVPPPPPGGGGSGAGTTCDIWGCQSEPEPIF